MQNTAFVLNTAPIIMPTSEPIMRQKSTYQFKIHKVDEAAALSRYAAGLFPDPLTAQAGLYELLLNAVEHGNLGITYQSKVEMLKHRKWYEEIAKRQGSPENIDKSVDLVVTRRPDGVYAVITDQGLGFNWRAWQNPVLLSEAKDTGAGRGIFKCKQEYFDKLSYNPIGNKVAAMQAL
jgi:anti-sigma regulatory factor (Ser/Thr protein kinase)